MSEDPDKSAAEAAPTPPSMPGAASAVSGQRPEVLIGAAFVGSFLVARILKRIFD